MGKIKRHILIVFTIIVSVCSIKAQGFQNPVIPGFYPDPSVCRVGNDFYLVTSSFEYFPGIPVFHSKDLIHWKQIGHCLTRPAQLKLDKCKSSEGLWAPTIRYHQGVFYMVNTNMSDGGHFYVTAQDPAGEWSDPIWIDQKGIDPSLFWDDDGSAYLVTNGGPRGEIILSKIDLETGKLLTEPFPVWLGSGGRNPEGPHIYKKDRWYYLLIAEGGVNIAHSATIARSRNIFGPYVGCPSNPILTHNCNLAQVNPIQGVGHGDLVEASDGSWWMLFLGHRPTWGRHYPLGRETFLAPVIWPKDGWPVINNGAPITLNMDCSTLPQYPWEETPVRDDFTNEKPGFEWNYLRTPVLENYSLSAKRGFLTLTGSALSLDEQDTPTFLGRRQQHFNFTATTQMEFSPAAANETAGLTVYMNNRYHYDLYLQKGNKLVLRYKIGTISHVKKEIKIKGEKVQLRVNGKARTYVFSYSDDNGKTFYPLDTIDTHLLSPLTAGGFTGVYVGLFASGNGKLSRSKACFDWFDYQEDKSQEEAWKGQSAAHERIEQHRKEDVRIIVKQKGKKISNVPVEMNMQRHEFLFGSAIFGSRWEKFEAYKTHFADIFNFATLLIYWPDMETEKDLPKYSLNELASWCAARNIRCKGHPLIYNSREPKWLTGMKREEVLDRVKQRCKDVVSHYKGSIDTWEAINELSTWEVYSKTTPNLTGLMDTIGKIDLAKVCFAAARQGNPDAVLMINDHTYDNRYPDILRQLTDKQGKPIYDLVGIQCHIHNHRELLNNDSLWAMVERLAVFNKPVHVTELTVVSSLETGGWPAPTTPEGEEQQKNDVERIYTLLFSHPAVEAITWWDLSDYNAWKGAPSGLLRKDMTPKPAYEALKKLIKDKWVTNKTVVTDAAGTANLRVFRGEYCFTVTLADGSKHKFIRTVGKTDKVIVLDIP